MRYLVVLLLLVTAASGQTITGVTGTPGDGETVYVIGTGFGSRSVTAASFFETWDWGTQNGDITASGDWELEGNADGQADPVRTCNEQVVGDSGYAMRYTTPDSITGSHLNDAIGRDGLAIWPEDKFYFSIWQWSTYAGAQEYSSYPACPQQWKPWNFNLSGLSVGPDFFSNWNGSGYHPPSGPEGCPRFINWFDNNQPDVGDRFTSTDFDTQPAVRTWWCSEHEVKIASDACVSDGTYTSWQDGGASRSYTEQSWCGDIEEGYVDDYGGLVHDHFTIHNYIQWDPACVGLGYVDNDTVYVDDVVCQIGDGAWARVMLCDTDTWTTNTVRHWQPINYWAADGDSIQITDFNQGLAGSGETWWLFVVDADGSVSDGFEIEIDGELASSAPGSPTVNRTGDSAAISWTAAVPQPNKYQVWIYENDNLRRSGVQVNGATTSVTVKVSDSAALRTYVEALDSDGQVQSTSGETYTAGS